MNYDLHYTKLIERARARTLSGYSETHHIIPKCIGGTDDTENLVELTPEEHFLAHLLLVKIYPNYTKLVNAAMMMCVESTDNSRIGNKRFGWLRRQHSVAMSQLQSGQNNSQFGTVWVYSLTEKVSKKVKKDLLQVYLDSGWHRGRVQDFAKTRVFNCVICNATINVNKKTCSKTCHSALIAKIQESKNPMVGREQEFLNLYAQTKSINASLKLMGFSGNNSHWGKYARSLLPPN